MIKLLPKKRVLFLAISMFCSIASFQAQKTVFTENFNAPGTTQSSSWTTSGPINNSRWNVSRSGNDFGAKIDGGILSLNNDVSSGGNSNGWVLASTTVANFAPGYNPILNQNAGIVSWSFNMKQPRENPNGLTEGQYGIAYVLAGTEDSSFSTGSGYAIMLGSPGTNQDPIRFVHYTNGISTYYTKFNSDKQGFKDFGRDYISVRVEYNPATSKWSFYLRKDNPTFLDPKGGTLYYQGEVTNNEHINKSLTMTGAYWVAGGANNQTALFDNISIDVVLPEITAIEPDSKIANSGAFALTVEGKGFTSASKIYWNGLFRNTTFVSATKITAVIPATDITLPRIVPITVKNGTYESNAVSFEVEPSGVPSLTLSKNTLPLISTVTGTASVATETYTIKGINLTAAATVTAPENFEISLNGTNYFDNLTLPFNAGFLTGGTLTLRARLKATAPAGNFTGNITHSTTGAVTKNVAFSGRVLATEPITNATAISFTNITSTGFKLNWSNGSGEQRLVLIREASAVNALPIDANTYSASSAFANGAEIGTGNYVVYKGTENNVQITSLQPNTIYHISIVEFNGAIGTENYKSSGAIANTKTLNSPAGLQLKAANTSYKIDFDNTVDGVNLDTFQGSGIAKNAEIGQLDSDSWAFTGFSGGNVNFGGESAEDSSYENGASQGNEVGTGLYAFNVGTSETENFTLGIQPGGSDFNPGTITLRIQNQTGVPMTSVNIGYKVYLNNDQDTSSKIAFSYLPTASTNGAGTYTSIPGLDVMSTITADLAPGWKAYYRVVTIPNLNIASNAYYYIRWSGSLVSGTGAQDEFAIDDIEVIANPSTNTVSFDGAAEDFVLHGDAKLSGDLSVQKSVVFNGGQLAINNKTLTIGGNVTNTTANGLVGGANSNLIIRGTKNPSLSFAQTASGNVLKNFSLIGANANTVTLTNPLTVNQLLQVDELQILDLGSVALNGTLNIVQNNGIIQTQNTTATPFSAGKTWNGTGILNLNATSTAQTLVAGTYNNLSLSSTAGTIATSDILVNGILDLPNANPSATKGSLDMATSTLVMGPDGVNIGVGDVTGIIRRDFFIRNKLYTFGHPNSSIIFPGGGTTLPTTMSAKLTLGAAPTWRTEAIKRYYDIIQTGAVSTKAIIRQHYLNSELNGNAETKLVFWGHKVEGAVDFEQGKSSNNITNNWVEISNANVAEYFQNEFDKVYITLDETAGFGQTTWTGTTNSSWTTLTNWTNGKPGETTKVIIPAGVPNYPTLNPSETIGSLIIEMGASVNSTDTSLLFLTDGAGAWQNYGTFNPGTGTSTITFNNLDATIAGSTTFNNIKIPSGAGIRPSEGSYMSIAGALLNNGTMFTTLIPNTIEFIGIGQTIPNVNGLDFGGYHNLIVSGTGASFASTISTLNVRGNLILNQPLSFAEKTINMTGVADQAIGGTVATNFNNLIVNKETGAVILAKDISVDGTLILTKGNLILGDKNLSLGSNPVSGTFSTETMIVADGSGTVRRKFANTGSYFFPIGELTGAPGYSPINIALTQGTFASNAFLGVNVVDAKHPENFSSQDFISRYWNVTQTGITNAVATITATYKSLDYNGEESAIAAAQLQGSFDLTNNPWTKFTSLANNTLFAEGAMLNSGQTSVFTGIKAGQFSVEVYGYGDFCLDSDVQIEAVVNNGDAPFNYIWSDGLPNSAIVTIPTNIAGTTDYTITVVDANGLRATDNNIPIDIFPQSTGGAISENAQIICAGSQPSDLELIGSIGKVLYWQSSTDINFVIDTENSTDDVTNISNFTTTLSGNQIGAIDQTTYFRAVLQNGDCDEQFSSIASVTVKSTTWNGITWSNGLPNAVTSAIFASHFTAAQSIEACSIVVNNNAVVLIPSGFDVTINGALKVETGSTFTLESNTNLIQTSDIQNSGEIKVERESSKLFRLDYTMWGSPVTGEQTLLNFSPLTNASRFYTYRSLDNVFTTIDPSLNVFSAGQGYLIRMPNTHTIYGPEVTATSWTGIFTGKPTNGRVSVVLDESGEGFNMLSNPYPSMISADEFLNSNSAELEGTLYFWRRRNAIPTGTEGTTAYYATYTLAGGTSVIETAPSETSATPNGYIQVGQGFIGKKNSGGSGIALFKNSMRTTANDENQFFKNYNTQDRSRIWLNVTNAAGEFGQTLVAYMATAENGVDRTDGKFLGDGSTALTSWLDNSEYIIQGRAPFETADIVTLNFKTLTAGTYKIAIDQVDGLFIGSQDIFLRDNFSGITHDLKEASYTFATEAGSFNSRFEIVYFNPLSVKNPVFDANSVILYKNENKVVINSGNVVLDLVEVYDVRGRLLAIAKSINSNEVSIIVGETNQVLIVKITSIDGIKVTKKTVN